MLAAGQAVVVITRNVDLSVGSVLGFTAYLTGRLFIDVPGIPIVVVVLARRASPAALLGLVNGLLVSLGRVPALVITLGTLYVYRGVVLTWAGSDRINAGDLPRELPAARHPVGARGARALPRGCRRRGGRSATTSTPTAADASCTPSGPTPRPRCSTGSRCAAASCSAFVLSGALAGLAGVMHAARYGTVSSGAGANIELEAVAAVVIGGVAIFGGSGTVWGAAIGAVLLVTIDRALPILGIPDFWQRAVVGLLIIGAIVLDRVLAARQARKLIEARDES